MGPFNSSGSPQGKGAVANAAGVQASLAGSAEIPGKTAFMQEISYHRDEERDERLQVI